MENSEMGTGTKECQCRRAEPAMAAYIGVKLVRARAMTRFEFGHYKQQPVEAPDADGYMVVYADGYESWCPRWQFEEANLPYPEVVPVDDVNEPTPRRVRQGEHLCVICLDAPGPGGASHQYEIVTAENRNIGACDVKFQKGPIQEKGVNGVQMEDLLAICIDRLTGFQVGDYPCHENAMALLACRAALGWLDKRTADRKARNVEGTSKQ